MKLEQQNINEKNTPPPLKKPSNSMETSLRDAFLIQSSMNPSGLTIDGGGIAGFLKSNPMTKTNGMNQVTLRPAIIEEFKRNPVIAQRETRYNSKKFASPAYTMLLLCLIKF